MIVEDLCTPPTCCRWHKLSRSTWGDRNALYWCINLYVMQRFRAIKLYWRYYRAHIRFCENPAKHL
jgi:hypothetical protein